jgi:hypothetical protein
MGRIFIHSFVVLVYAFIPGLIWTGDRQPVVPAVDGTRVMANENAVTALLYFELTEIQ